MDFILNEAIKEDNEFNLVFSDDSKGELFEEEDEGEEFNFTDDVVEEEPQDESFYRKVDNQPLKFLNQTRNFNEVIQDSHQEYFGEDDLPELFDPENREEVEFDFSEKNQSRSSKFKNSLLQFENVDNPFFYLIIYGLLYNKLNGKNIKLENTEKILGKNLFTDLKKIEKKTMLDHSIFGYFDQFQLINEILSEHAFFLRFYERRNKFRYQLKQNLKEKNKMKRELSSCAIQKFNGYELLRNNLNSFEKKDSIPIDIIYEPTLDENKKIECFFAPDISLAYVGYIEKIRNNEKYGK